MEGKIVTDEDAGRTADGSETPIAEVEDSSAQYGVGPFTIRELAILVAWALAFIVSFFSLSTVRFESVWTSGILWILTIGVPTVAVFLLVLRRFSPQGIRRVGSLGIDQFASVAFSVAAVLWLQLLWETIAFVVDGGPWLRGWVVWVELALMFALVVLTVFATFIEPLSEDFRGRPEVVAHRNARPVRKVVPRPRPVRPEPEPEPQARPEAVEGDAVAAAPEGYRTPTDGDRVVAVPFEQSAQGDTGAHAVTGTAVATGATGGASGTTGGYGTDSPVFSAAEPVASEDSTHTRAFDQQQAHASAAAPSNQAFWALVPEERDVVDERDIPIFRIGPTAWALVIEDRGETFVVRHDDGRIGYLHDVSGVTRG
ncbi:hypothetical protein ACLQ2Q_03400 [Microbacterium sp. DT81.1]|uniref:hypothetical protein n=1 Tax=Microbacterium sp. DT81.1 TaxID=3393413 RepID=UPI003CFBB50E